MELPREVITQIAAKNRAALLLFRQTCKDYMRLTGEYCVKSSVNLADLRESMCNFAADTINITADNIVIIRAPPRRIAFEFLLIGENLMIFYRGQYIYTRGGTPIIRSNYPHTDGKFAVFKGEAQRVIEELTQPLVEDEDQWVGLTRPWKMYIYTTASEILTKQI